MLMGQAASVDLGNLMSMRNGVFWWVLNIVMGLTIVMLVLYLFNTFAIKERFPESGMMANIKSLSDSVLPIIGNMAFLPIVSILLDVFICTETSGRDLEDAFLHKDCY
jgi:hypothetical protein